MSSARPRTILLAALVPTLLVTAAAAQPARLPTADDVKALQGLYRGERAEAVKSGATKRFLPILLDKADELAKKAETALAEGRLLQASEGFRQARWQLPYQSMHFPDHVSHILGNLRLRHGRGLNAVAYSPDGLRLATAGADALVKIWDLGNGHELVNYAGHTGAYVRQVAFTPDGKTVVTAGADKDIKVWDADTGKDQHTIEGKGQYVNALAISRDGKHILAGLVSPPDGDPNQAALLQIFETRTGKLVRTDSDFRARISTFAFDPAGKILAVGDETGQIRMWDFPAMVANPNQPPYWSQQDSSGATYSVVFSPDGQTLVRCGQLDAKLYNVVQPGAAFQVAVPRRTFPVPAQVLCAAFSKDGKTLFTGSNDGLIRHWDVENGGQTGTFRGHSGPVWGLAFNPAGSQLASASTNDYVVRLWDFDVVLQSRDLAGHASPVWMASFSPDGQRLVSAGADNALKIWNVATGQVLQELAGQTAPVTAALYSPDGKLIASAGGDKIVRLWDARTGKPTATAAGHTGTITALDFSPDSTKVASGSADKLIKIWDAATGKGLVSIDNHPSVVTSVAFSPDGKTLAVGSVDQSITLYDPATGKSTFRWAGHGEAVTCLAYSPNGQYLASGGADQVVQIWTTATMGHAPIRVAGHSGPVSMIAFRKDSQHLVSGGSDGLVRLWKIEGVAAKELQVFRGHKDWVTSVAFNRDGYHIVSASVDRVIKIWEITSRDLPLIPEHTSAVEAVAFSPDGKILATASADQTIKLWDPATGVELATLSGHEGPVLSLVFTPDSKALVSSGGEAAIRLWEVNPPREIARTPAQLQSFSRLRRYSRSIFLEPEGKTLYAWLPVNETKISTMVEAFDLKLGTLLFSFFEDNRVVRSLAFSANGKLAVTGAKDGSVRLWDLEKKGQPLPGGDWFLFEKVGVADLALTSDGKLLVVSNDNGDIKIATVASREVRKTFSAHKGMVNCCVTSPDNQRIATVGADNIVKLWDMDGKELRRWDMGGDARGMLVMNLAFTPDSRQLVTANANTTAYILELP